MQPSLKKKGRRRSKKEDSSLDNGHCKKETSIIEEGSKQEISQVQIHRQGDEETMGGPNESKGEEQAFCSLPRPYQFLKFADPPIYMIFFPHFTVKSLVFIITLIWILMFLFLVIYNSQQKQDQFTWNCSLFKLQNKYFPRLRYNYQIWRVFVSSLFHSNVAHFIINLFGMQIYGYFVEWYIGTYKLTVAFFLSMVLGHFMATVASPVSVSTISSSMLFCVLGVKAVFFYEYWAYKALFNKRVFIYLLYGLVIGLNLIPILVVNNIDYAAHIGGYIVGLLGGVSIYLHKQQKATTFQSILKIASLVAIGAMLIAFIAVTFTTDSQHYVALNNGIADKCS